MGRAAQGGARTARSAGWVPDRPFMAENRLDPFLLQPACHSGVENGQGGKVFICKIWLLCRLACGKCCYMNRQVCSLGQSQHEVCSEVWNSQVLTLSRSRDPVSLTPPGNPRFSLHGLALVLCSRQSGHPEGRLAELPQQGHVVPAAARGC